MAPGTLALYPQPAPTYEAGDGLRGLYNATLPSDQIIRSSKQPDPEPPAEEVDRPTIKFEPSRDDFEARAKRLAEKRKHAAAETLPVGFPPAITGDRVWVGKNVKSLEEFMVHLGAEDVAELEAALAHFKDLPGENGPEQMSKELFPLPTLGPRLEEMSRVLHSGRGIVILRGLVPTKYSALDNILLFAGLGSYIGEQRGCQDRFGNMLTHLVDMGFKFGRCSKRTPTFTQGCLPYHNDVCDILAMYIQDCATNGGESILASSATVYNQIAATRPDMIKTLAAPIWIYDKDKPPAVWNARPILFPETNHGPFFCFSRQKITGSEHYPLSPTLPAMSEEQAEVLDMVHYIAEENGITMTLDPGDILLYNNLGVLHGRNAFNDDVRGDHRRHILRLWLRNEDLAWQTPPGLERDWFLVYGESERRGRAHWRVRPEDMDRDRVIGHKMTCS